MVFNKSLKPIICPHCGYKAYPPYPQQCPNCQKIFEQHILEDNSVTDRSPNQTSHQKESNKNEKNQISNEKLQDQELLKILQTQSKKKKNLNHNYEAHPKEIFQLKTEEEINPLKNFATNIRLKSHPDMVVSGNLFKVKENNGSTKTSIKEAQQIKHAPLNLVGTKQEDHTSIDLSKEKLELGVEQEYFRYFGIITRNRQIIYNSNEHFTYLLDLAYNLEYIATSILSGTLDRMFLLSLDKEREEYCYFRTEQNLIFVLYGNIPDKKATWLMHQIYITFNDLIDSRVIDSLSKIDVYNIQTSLNKRLKYFLSEYIKLQSVFSSNELTSIDNFLRVDYFGLSFQSVGILSKLITNELPLPEFPSINSDYFESDDIQTELLEGQITAKLEAMAANCVANTNMIPEWISVKLGYQRYRFIVFSKIEEYYISLLTEGNLEYRDQILGLLKKRLNSLTSQPFVGELKAYYDQLPNIISDMKNRNNHKT